jgi:dihydroneopterin aldolase
MLIQTVALRDVKCFAYHGFYVEEQVLGTQFLVSIEVKFEPTGDTEDLQHTVNYEVLNNIIQDSMKRTQKLLETVVHGMLEQVKAAFPFALNVVVGIKKLHPPMPGQIDHSFVQLQYTAEQKK